MARINVEDLVRAAEEKYDFWEVDFGDDGVVRFGNPMRLGREAREGVFGAFGDLGKLHEGKVDEVEGDVVDVCRRLFKHSCIQGDAELLFKLVGEDTALWGEVLGAYFEAVKLGEALRSAE